MSGLITFFKSFLSTSVTDSDYNKRLEELTQDEEVLRDSPHSTALTEQFKLKPLTFREWREENKKSVMEYFRKRLASTEHEENNSNGEHDDNDDDYETDNEIHPESSNLMETSQIESTSQHLPLESQELFASQELQQQKQNSMPEISYSAKERRRKRVPSMHETIHCIHTLEYLDLMTKELSLSLCKITKVWRLRETKRGNSWRGANTLPRQCPLFPGPLPRIAYGSMQDDGPLAIMYKYVLTLEVQQISNTKSNARQTNIRIYLYNSYAKATWDWLENYQDATYSAGGSSSNSYRDLILSLHKVPAISILPYVKDPKDVLDQHQFVDYCICIGDSSSMTVASPGNEVTFLRADSCDVEVCLASTAGLTANASLALDNDDTDGHTKELVLSRDSLGGENITITTPNRLLQAWLDHQNHKDPVAPSAVPLPPMPLPASNMFLAAKTETATATLTERIQAATGPADKVLPDFSNRNLPPPPTPLKHPPEPMILEGPAKKRQRTDETVLPSNGTAANRTLFPDDYTYTKLAALRDKGVAFENGQRRSIHAYAVVMGFTAPTQTKRGDWMVTVSLLDETTTQPITLVAFDKTIAQLPPVAKVGDVLRMHRVFLQIWNNDIQIQGLLQSSYVVVRRTPKDSGTITNQDETKYSWVVVPSSPTNFTFDSDDESYSQSLWLWGQKLVTEQPTISETHRFSLREATTLSENAGDRDLTVMVTAIVPWPPNQEHSGITPRGLLRVWDGTGESNSDPWPFQTMLTQQSQKQGDPPSEAVTKVASVIQSLNIHRQHSQSRKDPTSRQEETAPTSLLAPKALCGKVVNGIIWEETQWKRIQDHVRVGTFLRLRNIVVNAIPYRGLSIHSKSWLSPLPDEAYDVAMLLNQHDTRVWKQEFNLSSGLLPVVLPPVSSPRGPIGGAPTTSISKQRTELGSGLAAFASRTKATPSRYQGIVKLMEPTIPEFKGNLKVYCTRNKAGGSCSYRFVVTVADQSTYIQVLVSDKAAEIILGLPAKEAAGGVFRKSPFDTKVAWNATIQSVQNRGQRFFVLLDLLREDEI